MRSSSWIRPPLGLRGETALQTKWLCCFGEGLALWIGDKSRRNLVLRETVGTNEKCVHWRLNSAYPASESTQFRTRPQKNTLRRRQKAPQRPFILRERVVHAEKWTAAARPPSCLVGCEHDHWNRSSVPATLEIPWNSSLSQLVLSSQYDGLFTLVNELFTRCKSVLFTLNRLPIQGSWPITYDSGRNLLPQDPKHQRWLGEGCDARRQPGPWLQARYLQSYTCSS